MSECSFITIPFKIAGAAYSGKLTADHHEGVQC